MTANNNSPHKGKKDSGTADDDAYQRYIDAQRDLGPAYVVFNANFTPEMTNIAVGPYPHSDDIAEFYVKIEMQRFGELTLEMSESDMRELATALLECVDEYGDNEPIPDDQTLGIDIKEDLISGLLRHTTADSLTEAVERAVMGYQVLGNIDQHLQAHGLIDDERIDMRHL